jgi:hypothetical protein
MKVVYEIVTRVVVPAELGPLEVQRRFEIAVGSLVDAYVPRVYIDGAQIEKVRVVSMYIQREGTDATNG